MKKKIVNMKLRTCTRIHNRTNIETEKIIENRSAVKKKKNYVKSLKLKLLCFVKVLRDQALWKVKHPFNFQICIYIWSSLLCRHKKYKSIVYGLMQFLFSRTSSPYLPKWMLFTFTVSERHKESIIISPCKSSNFYP